MVKDVALQHSASLITLLSSIQATSNRKTRRGGYTQNQSTMNEYRDEKTELR
jgi:hypothetical protein